MAAFPTLTPHERNYDLGQVPTSEFRGEGAVAVLFRTGTLRVGQRLQLVYQNRPKAEVQSIWEHYYGQQNAEFTVPSQVWCGHSAGSTIADSSLRWRYAERPEPVRVSAGVYSITVTLEAIGISIAPTAAGLLELSDVGVIDGLQLSALPARPVPVPDPPILPPVITDVPPSTPQLPIGFVNVGAGVELRFASGGILETGGVAAGSQADQHLLGVVLIGQTATRLWFTSVGRYAFGAGGAAAGAGVELRYASGGLLEPADVVAGAGVELRFASGGLLESGGVAVGEAVVPPLETGGVAAGEAVDLSEDP